MAKIQMSVHLSGPVTIENAADVLGIPLSRIDKCYGVVEVDPDLRLFAVLVEQDGGPTPVFDSSDRGEGYRGPFSNPRIEPFGPTKSKTPES